MTHPVLTLFQAGTGKLCPHHNRSLVTFQWMLQMSSYFMTLFLWTFFTSHWGRFSKRIENFEKLKKKKNQFRHQRVPLLEKNSKKIYIFFKKSCISTSIWILPILTFLLMYIKYILLKVFKFSIFCYKIFFHDELHSSTSSARKKSSKDIHFGIYGQLKSKI